MKLMKFASGYKMDKDKKDAVRRSAISSVIGELPVGVRGRILLNRIYAAGEGQTTDNKHSAVGLFGGARAVNGARAKDTGNSTALETIGTSALITSAIQGASPLVKSNEKFKQETIGKLKTIQNIANTINPEGTDEKFNEDVENSIKKIKALTPEELKSIRNPGKLAGEGLIAGAALGSIGYGFGKLFGNKNNKKK